MGLVKVKDYCEMIQHFGVHKDETGIQDLPDDESCLDRISTALKNMREEYEKVDRYFSKLYPAED